VYRAACTAPDQLLQRRIMISSMFNAAWIALRMACSAICRTLAVS
jgi:hypothetical protein